MPRSPAPAPSDLPSVFAALRALLAPYAARLQATRDDALELYVDTRHRQKNGKPLFFAALQPKPALFDELARLVEAGYASYQGQGFVP